MLDMMIEETFTEKLKVPVGLQVTLPEKRGWIINPLGQLDPLEIWLLICWSESSWNCVSVSVWAGGAGRWLSTGVTIDVPAPDRFARRICGGSTVFPEGGSMDCAVAGL